MKKSVLQNRTKTIQKSNFKNLLSLKSVLVLAFFIFLNQFAIAQLLKPNKKNVLANQIIFSKTPFTADAKESTDVEFAWPDRIYGRILFGKPMEEFFTQENLQHLYIYAKLKIKLLPGEINISTTPKFSDADLKKTYFDFDIMPDPAKASTNFEQGDFLFMRQLVYQISNKKYEVTMTLGQSSILEGKFSLNLKTVDIEQLKKEADLATENAKKAGALSAQLPADFNETNKLPNDAEVNTIDKIKAVIMAGTTIKTIKKISVQTELGETWRIHKDNYNMPLSKVLRAKILVYFTSKKDEKCRVESFTFIKEYEGGGKYGLVKLAPDKPEMYFELPCDK